MTPKRRNSRSAVFDRCARSVRTTLANGRSTPVQVENMRRGRLNVLGLIRDLASPRPKHAAFVERALHDLHPHTEYCNQMLIRDLADVCVTLSRLEQGRRRTNREKLIESALLCEYLKDEFTSVPQIPNSDAK